MLFALLVDCGGIIDSVCFPSILHRLHTANAVHVLARAAPALRFSAPPTRSTAVVAFMHVFFCLVIFSGVFCVDFFYVGRCCLLRCLCACLFACLCLVIFSGVLCVDFFHVGRCCCLLRCFVCFLVYLFVRWLTLNVICSHLSPSLCCARFILR